MVSALAEIRTVTDVRRLIAQIDSATAITRAAGMFDATQNLIELRLRTERRAGGILRNDAEKGMRAKPGNQPISKPNTLLDLGVQPMQSSRWQKIAGVPDLSFESYLADTRAARLELSHAGLFRMEKRAAGKREAGALPQIDGQFPTIVADPPWEYTNKASRGAATDHYPTMSHEEIADLDVGGTPIEQLKHPKGAHLYLWTPHLHLAEGWAVHVVRAWGFEPKCVLTWVKPQIGIGNWFRSSSEHVIFAVAGTLAGLADGAIGTWFEADRQRHSEKPDAFYEIVERFSPGPRLELFARAERKGWTGWGDELA
jgi:N6-adenosine-specific RNA methylase IME4